MEIWRILATWLSVRKLGPGVVQENQVWSTVCVPTMVWRVSRFLQFREPLERGNVTSRL